MNSNQETNIVSCWRKKNKSWRGIGLLIKGLTLAVSFEDKIVRNLFYLPPPCVVWQAKGYQVTRVALKQSQPFLAWFSTISILHNHPVHHLSNLLLTSANFYRMPLSAVLYKLSLVKVDFWGKKWTELSQASVVKDIKKIFLMISNWVKLLRFCNQWDLPFFFPRCLFFNLIPNAWL